MLLRSEGEECASSEAQSGEVLNSFTSQTPMAKRQNVTSSFDSFWKCHPMSGPSVVTRRHSKNLQSFPLPRLRLVKTCFDGQPPRPCGPVSAPICDFRPRWNDGGLSACEGNGGSFKHLCILFMPCESHLIILDSLAFLHLHLNLIHLRSSSVYLSLVHSFLQLLYSLIVGQYDTSARRICNFFF
jgi:hypothetical protein